MHNHVANRGRKALLKQIFSVFLIFTLYFNSFNSAFASASLGGWTVNNLASQGASTVINASKTVIENGVSIIKNSTAKITPTASQVAKILRGGAAGYALSIAVEQLIGAVDWVLDPANNQILYSDPTAKEPTDPTVEYYFVATDGTKHIEQKDACQIRINQLIADVPTRAYTFLRYQNDSFFRCVYSIDHTVNPDDTFIVNVSRVANPAYDPTAEEDKKQTLPLDVVGQQVIDNANAGDAAAQQATSAAAQDLLNNDAATQQDVTEQLETNAKESTSEQATGNTKPNEANPEVTDISLNFPAFCGWAPSICQAANVVINFPTTLTNWWTTATSSISDAWTWTKARYEASVTSISDFFKNEPDQTDNTDLPIQEIPTPQLETNAFSATPGCPEPIPIQIKIGVEGTAHISYEPICQFAEKWSFIAPLIGFLSGAMIIVGVGRKGEDSEI